MSGTPKEELYVLSYHWFPRVIVLNCRWLRDVLRLGGLQHGSFWLEEVYDGVIVVVDSLLRLVVLFVEAPVLQSRRGVHFLVVRLAIPGNAMSNDEFNILRKRYHTLEKVYYM